MSKYFPPPIIPKPAPSFEERVKEAIIDLEKRVDKLESLIRVSTKQPVVKWGDRDPSLRDTYGDAPK